MSLDKPQSVATKRKINQLSSDYAKAKRKKRS